MQASRILLLAWCWIGHCAEEIPNTALPWSRHNPHLRQGRRWRSWQAPHHDIAWRTHSLCDHSPRLDWSKSSFTCRIECEYWGLPWAWLPAIENCREDMGAMCFIFSGAPFDFECLCVIPFWFVGSSRHGWGSQMKNWCCVLACLFEVFCERAVLRLESQNLDCCDHR